MASRKPPRKETSRTEIAREPVPLDAYPVGGLPTNLDFEKSLMFFHAYMYGPIQGKLRLYKARSIPPGTVAMSSDWEVFASMLVSDIGRKFGPGIDLANYEVKSAKRGSSYEYQYHKDTGRQKLAKDMEVGHLFFDYANNLSNVDLRYAHGSLMKEFFEQWIHNFPDPYPQRYRKNIPYLWVRNNGVLLMTLTDGEVTYPVLVTEEAPQSETAESGDLERQEE